MEGDIAKNKDASVVKDEEKGITVIRDKENGVTVIVERDEEIFDEYANDYATVRLLDQAAKWRKNADRFGFAHKVNESRWRKPYADDFKDYVKEYHSEQDRYGHWHVVENLAVLLQDMPADGILERYPELGRYMDDAKDMYVRDHDVYKQGARWTHDELKQMVPSDKRIQGKSLRFQAAERIIDKQDKERFALYDMPFFIKDAADRYADDYVSLCLAESESKAKALGLPFNEKQRKKSALADFRAFAKFVNNDEDSLRQHVVKNIAVLLCDMPAESITDGRPALKQYMDEAKDLHERKMTRKEPSQEVKLDESLMPFPDSDEADCGYSM